MKPLLRKVSDMLAVEIKSKLLFRGVTQMDIARSLQVSHSTVAKVISGVCVSHRIRTAIAEVLGLDLKEIWPSTYLYGEPCKKGRPRSIGFKK